jgi:long-subunit fatty acid transport protein
MKSYRGTNFLLLVALFVTGYAIADDFHYNNVLIGNRAAGLAGAYTAISDDATGLFYNPAGIVFSDTLQLSASANAVHTSTGIEKHRPSCPTFLV